MVRIDRSPGTVIIAITIIIAGFGTLVKQAQPAYPSRRIGDTYLNWQAEGAARSKAGLTRHVIALAL
jgi:hypothetical protein